MTAERRKKINWLIINLILAACESYLCFALLFRRGRGFDPACLLKYANYANFTVFVSSWILVIGCIAELSGGREHSYYGFRLFRYMAVTAETLTFSVAIFIALPLTRFDFSSYLTDISLLECIICPALAYFSFTRFGDYSDFSMRETVMAVIPGLLYHGIIVTFNAIGIMDGPYSFQKAGDHGIGKTLFWAVLIIGGTFIVAQAILLAAQAHGPIVKKKVKRTVRNIERKVND